jgi:hypothetical protein
MENSLHRSKRNIPMGLTEDVLLASSCHTMVGMDWTGASSKLFAALFALRHAGIGTDLMIDLNDSGSTFDEIADYVDQCHELANGKS